MVRLLALVVCVSIIACAHSGKSPIDTLKKGISSNSKSKQNKLQHYQKNNKNNEVTPIQTILANSNAASSDEAFKRGVLSVVGGFLAHLTLGTIYCWANFMSYSPEKLRFFDGLSHPGMSPDSLLVIPLTLGAQCLTIPFGPMICSKLGSSRTLLLGSWIMALGVFLASFFTENLSIFLLFYSLMFGLGVGVGYTAPMLAGYKWLPQSKGIISGGVLAGYGLGGFFFNLIGTNLVNPKGFNPIKGKFPAEVYANFPIMLRKLSAVYVALSFIGSMLVTEPKTIATTTATTIKTAAASGSKLTATKSTTAAASASMGVELMEALKSPQFWQLWVLTVTSASCGLNVASIYKQFAGTSSVLAGDSYQALVGGLGAIFNGTGRLFWGSVSDKIGVKTSFLILTVFQAVLQFFFPYSTATKPLFAAFTCMSYFCLAGSFALIPPATQKLFGPKNGATIYGIVYSAFGLAAIGGQFASKALVKNLKYEGMFRTFAVSSLFATLVASFLKPLASYAGSSV